MGAQLLHQLGGQVPWVGVAQARRNLRFVATDLNWSGSTGPYVSGPGEAILMAVNGRRDPIRDLTGPGVEVLVDRLAAGVRHLGAR